jgi:hypothetical protein
MATKIQSTNRTSPKNPQNGNWVVTPSVAESWLSERNDNNRRLRQKVVLGYRRDMSAGKWQPHHQGIAFSEDGKLLDGQHRLQAIVDSGVSVPLRVTTGVPQTAFITIDTGLKRLGADVLEVPNVSTVIGILNVEHYINTKERSATNLQLIDLLETNPDVEAAADTVVDTRQDSKGWLSGSALGWVYLRAFRVDPEVAKTYVDTVVRGLGLIDGGPAYTLRNRMRRMNKDQGQFTKQGSLYYLTRTWSAIYNKTTLSRLQIPAKGINMQDLPGPGMGPKRV